jgi:hypothetical protein
VSGLLPDRDRGRRKIRVGEGADGYGDVTGKALPFPVDRGAAGRAEVEGERIAAFGRAGPRNGLTGDGGMLAAEACLVADHGTSAALALQAVTHRDANALAINDEVKLAAVAGGAAGGHGMLSFGAARTLA